MDSLVASIERTVLDPKYHDVLALAKGIRNGAVYGTKVRFPHALVMIFLFRSGTVRQKLYLIIKATRQHARNLGLFALIYKSTLLILRHTSPDQKERRYDTFLAGLLGGYMIFGRGRSSVNQQIVIYVFARVVLGLAKLAVKPKRVAVGRSARSGGLGLVPNDRLRELVLRNSWPVFASLSWASVMFLFRWHPEILQPSLRSSMNYIYVDSDKWDSLRNFLWHNK